MGVAYRAVATDYRSSLLYRPVIVAKASSCMALTIGAIK